MYYIVYSVITIASCGLLKFSFTHRHKGRRYYGCSEEGLGKGIVREFGIDMYDLIDFK